MGQTSIATIESVLDKQSIKPHVYYIIHVTKTTAAQNEAALNYYTMHGLCSPAVVFAPTIASEEILIIAVFTA